MNNFSKIMRRLRRRKRKVNVDQIDINDLKKIFILNELKSNDRFLKMLLKYCYILTISHGNIIYNEGERSNDMYIVLNGTVRILKRTSAGEEFMLTKLTGSNGGFFGEVGLILGKQQRTATVLAETNTKLLVLSQRKFIELAKHHPSIAIGLTFSICRVVCERLQRCNADLAYLYDALAYEASEV